MRLLLVGIALLASCVEPGHVDCNDGRLCPAGFTCSPLGCVAPDQLTSCEGKADDEVCDVAIGQGRCQSGTCIVAICGNGVIELPEVCDDGNQLGTDGCNGTCSSDESCGNGLVELEEECDCGADVPSDQASCEGTVNGGTRCTTSCTIARCGNGVMDPGEVCDDGNGVGGDGCSYDCLSAEACGNGILDFFAGEQCDDGNTRSIDGCSRSCKVESQTWRALSVESPEAVRDPAVAYDSHRRVLVAFGGSVGLVEQDITWQLEGATWTRATYVTHPIARTTTAMAYDEHRQRIVLFGGFGGVVHDDTWEYDGARWHKMTPATVPPGRFSHRLAYDAKRQRVVMFGGETAYGGNTFANDTWEWDGVNWTKITPTTSPPTARSAYGLTYDSVRGRIVLYGGRGSGAAVFGDTWEYDGTTWTARTITGPAARSSCTLTYDPRRGQVVMAGGTETWTLDTDGWEQITGADPDRMAHGAAYDFARGAVVLFGGSLVSTGQATATIAELGASSWPLASTATPAGATGHTVTYDVRRGRVVLLRTDFGNPMQTWELDGLGWRRVTTAASPTPRTGHSLAYDAARDRVVVFGGSSTASGTSGTRLADTWEYDGTNWAVRSPTASPPARTNHAMVYDSVRSRIVMFGGASGSAFDDTWEYDGSTWTQVTSTTKPHARSGHAMAYDSARQRIVMLGGTVTGGSAAVTWTFVSGTGWSTLAGATGPGALRNPALAYDAGRDRVVLHGGFDVIKLNDTWELVGDQWVNRVPSTSDEVGPRRWQHALVYDASRSRIVLFGGAQNDDVFDTWTFETVAVEAGEACTASTDVDGDTLAGCADDDCWGRCSPLCVPDAPAASCVMTPRCGDGVCDGVESCRTCASDCTVGSGACPLLCGDGYCDSPENATSCPGDC